MTASLAVPPNCPNENGEPAIEQRKSARAILLNDQNQVLLIQHEDTTAVDPAHPGVLCYWATPGGGIEVGERSIDALRRELLEELGVTDIAIGRKIGVRNVSLHLPDEGSVFSHETYFMCRVSQTLQLNHAGLSDCERGTFRGIRWWSLEELHNATAILRPGTLPELVENALCTDSKPIILQD